MHQSSLMGRNRTMGDIKDSAGVPREIERKTKENKAVPTYGSYMGRTTNFYIKRRTSSDM